MNYEDKYLKISENNWWFVSRNDLIVRLVNKYSSDKNVKILEIGCAQGYLIERLRDIGYKNASGVDVDKGLINKAKAKGLNVLCMDIMNNNFDDESFDLIICSDIMEHIKDEYKFVSEVKRILKRNGVAFVFVPAFMFLWSYHDEINRHYKRYKASDLKKLFSENGFEIEKLSYWNMSFFIPALVSRFIKRLFNIKKDEFYGFPEFINSIISFILKIENRLVEFINLPFGVSVFAVVRKK